MSGLPWSETLELIGRSRFTDLLVPARTGRSGSRLVVVPLFDEIYLELEGGGFLQLASVNSHGGLSVRPVDDIDYTTFAYDDEPAEDLLLISLASQYFHGWETIECGAVVYTVNEESDLDRSIVRGLELLVSGGQRLFFDPMDIDGIRLGNSGTYDAWNDRHQIGPWTTRSHTWKRS